jgi:hypothetical protein
MHPAAGGTSQVKAMASAINDEKGECSAIRLIKMAPAIMQVPRPNAARSWDFASVF